MRATKHYQYGLLDPQRKEKKKNYLHGRAPNKQKRNKEIFLVFILVLQQFKLGRKIEKKQETYFWIFSKFFKHTRRKRENKLSMDDTMKMCGHRQLE